MSDERVEWTICGRLIGTATGWDHLDTFAMTVYDLEPVEGLNIPRGDYAFYFENGMIEGGWPKVDDGSANEPTILIDLIDAIKDLPVRRTS